MSCEARRTFDPSWVRRAVVQNVVTTEGIDEPLRALDEPCRARRFIPPGAVGVI